MILGIIKPNSQKAEGELAHELQSPGAEIFRIRLKVEFQKYSMLLD